MQRPFRYSVKADGTVVEFDFDFGFALVNGTVNLLQLGFHSEEEFHIIIVRVGNHMNCNNTERRKISCLLLMVEFLLYL